MLYKQDKRQHYWENNYLKYWRERVKLQNTLSKKDSLPPDMRVYKKFYDKIVVSLKKKGEMLDVGVGFGRFLTTFQKDFPHKVWGTDISQQMIDYCKKTYPGLKKHLFAAPAEKQPFTKKSFSFINVWATFDAVYQEKTLRHILELLDDEGLILLTGKNFNYYDTDKKALEAEINARKKKHPNYFTNTKKLISLLKRNNIEILYQYFFKRRGDFAKFSHVRTMPKKFYEYAIIVKKTKNKVYKKFPTFSYKYSDTFKRVHI
ncbi:MAG TPA: hypothetical protein DCX25_03860 [Candidatus Pacebacteria bacterium]|nr:MAG: Ubiquinone/menaquinone biosynthesis methyltransferase UbiE [Microgenomates group bacterium GW2011_GWC1_46_15]HAV15441.1 hypothetical protein [Candidatus Paceibacterota bacterium]HCR11500.1 hypothetical protein [Candidatus Paceibacterota bacterium]HCR92951.1 hypothetical protein [Candidatus Paceibacterota bacterium]